MDNYIYAIILNWNGLADTIECIENLKKVIILKKILKIIVVDNASSNSEGKKIWESINYIDGKDFFEKIKSAPKLDVTLVEYNKNLVFSVSVNDFTEFTNASILDKENGKELKRSFLEYNNNTSHQMNKAFISNTYDYKGLKKEIFPKTSFAAIILNDNLLNYLKSIANGDKRLYFQTVFSEQGIFIVETDNRNYFKVLLFKE